MRVSHISNLCTQEGQKKANYWGSLCMASTVRLGNDAQGNAVHVPLRNLLPTVHPNDLVLGGWDICSDNLADAMVKASVLVSEVSPRRSLRRPACSLCLQPRMSEEPKGVQTGLRRCHQDFTAVRTSAVLVLSPLVHLLGLVDQ